MYVYVCVHTCQLNRMAMRAGKYRTDTPKITHKNDMRVVCVYFRLDLCVYMLIHKYTYTCTLTHTHTYTHKGTQTDTDTNMKTYKYIHNQEAAEGYMYIYTNICIWMYV